MSTNRKPSQRYNPGSLDETDTETLKMGIAEELWDISTSFLQTDEILGDAHEKIETLEIDRDNANARIEEIYRLSVEGDVALAEKITNISAEMETENAATSAAIKDEARARADADSALAEKITTLKADVETGDSLLSSQITETNRVVSDLKKTTAENKLELESSISSVKDTAKNELADAEKALAEAIARGDEAEAERLRGEIARLQGIIDANKADIESKLSITNSTIAELDKTMAQNKTELESKIVASEGSAVDAAVSQAKKDLSAAQAALDKAIKDGDAEEAKRLQDEVKRLLGVIESNKLDIEAKLTVTNTTIADVNKALSSQITNVEADYNGKFAGVNQELSATVDKLGKVEAKWGIEMDVNGKISGVSLNNNGSRSNFEVRADVFSFSNHQGQGIYSSGGVTTFNGQINVAEHGSNVGMKITNSQILIYDEHGRLRVRLGRLS